MLLSSRQHRFLCQQHNTHVIIDPQSERLATVARHNQMVRVFRVFEALAKSGQRGVALKLLAQQNGWNPRSLYRDIELLEAAGCPILHENHRFRFVDDFRPSVQLGLGADELAALFVAKQLGHTLGATKIGRALDSLWKKATAHKSQSSLFDDPASPLFSVRAPFAVDYSQHEQTITRIERALQKRVALSARYRTLGTGEITDRIIEPGQLHWDPGLESLYLIAHCQLRGDVRVFAVHRFINVALTRETIRERPTTKTERALRNAFRVWRGQRTEQVTIHFHSRVSAEIRDRKWHKNQTLKALPGGAVRLTLDVAGLEEVERWVLGYGADARVVAPKALAKRVAAAHRQAAAQYRKDARARKRGAKANVETATPADKRLRHG